jgi:hypothetical protein
MVTLFEQLIIGGACVLVLGTLIWLTVIEIKRKQ